MSSPQDSGELVSGAVGGLELPGHHAADCSGLAACLSGTLLLASLFCWGTHASCQSLIHCFTPAAALPVPISPSRPICRGAFFAVSVYPLLIKFGLLLAGLFIFHHLFFPLIALLSI